MANTLTAQLRRNSRFVARNRIFRVLAVRFGLGIGTLGVTSLMIFLAIAALPGDFARTSLGRSATEETVQAFRRDLGLDRPVYERYVVWIGGALQGNFGMSLSSKPGHPRYVVDIMGPRLLNTLFLAALVALFAVPLALGLGMLCALWHGGLFDRFVSAVSLVVISFPEFFIAYILTYLVFSKDTFVVSQLAQFLPQWLASRLQDGVLAYVPNFPTIASVDPGTSFIEHAWRISLPALTLTLVIVAHIMRMTRAVLISLLASPYIEMARLKGLSPLRVVTRHAMRNAWGPVSVVVALNLAYLIAGVVMVEVVFVYPGIGQLMVDAVKSRDIPVVQACALIFAATYILLNLLADIVGIVTNPRLLHAR